MKRQKLIDDIIPEPLEERITIETTLQLWKNIMKAFNELKDLSTKDLIAQRMDKYSKMGEYKSKIFKFKKIRSPTVSDFFCYKQKTVSYKQLFVISQQQYF
jgi:hypothetical protein